MLYSQHDRNTGLALIHIPSEDDFYSYCEGIPLWASCRYVGMLIMGRDDLRTCTTMAVGSNSVELSWPVEPPFMCFHCENLL